MTKLLNYMSHFAPRVFHLILFLIIPLSSTSQIIEEEDVEAYTLPDPLRCLDGTKVTSISQWQKKRRPEIIEICEREMYGRSPLPPQNSCFEAYDYNEDALDGRATRKQVTVFFNGQTDGPKMDILIYLMFRKTGL